MAGVVLPASNGQSSRTIIHAGVQCDGCGQFPIRGPRFQSTTQENYDLCDHCQSNSMGTATVGKGPFVQVAGPGESLKHLLACYCNAEACLFDYIPRQVAMPCMHITPGFSASEGQPSYSVRAGRQRFAEHAYMLVRRACEPCSSDAVGVALLLWQSMVCRIPDSYTQGCSSAQSHPDRCAFAAVAACVSIYEAATTLVIIILSKIWSIDFALNSFMLLVC